MMFYITFTLKGGGIFSRVARVSIDNGPCFDVRDGDVFHIPPGKERTLKIYQSKDAKARKSFAWTVPLSGKDGAYCNVDIFPYNTDPKETGAPHFAHYWTPHAQYKQEMEYAAQNMTRGEYNVRMSRMHVSMDNFAPILQKSRPAPLK